MLLILLLSTSCTTLGQGSARAWTSYDFLVVVQSGSKLVLEGIDVKAARADALTMIAKIGDDVVPEASVFLAGDTGSVVVNISSDPFSAEVFNIDRPKKVLRDLGSLVAGRLPIGADADQLVGFGSSGTGYVLTSVGLPGLDQTESTPFAAVPYGGDGSCVLGTGSAGEGPMLIASGPSVDPFPLTPTDVASSVACRGGQRVVTVSGRIDPTVTGKQEPTAAAELAVVDGQGVLQRWPVAGKPRLVCLLDSDRAVADLDSAPGHRAAQLVDVRSGAAREPIALGELQSVQALSCDHDTIVAAGDASVVVADPAGGHDPISIDLTGDVRSSVVRW